MVSSDLKYLYKPLSGHRLILRVSYSTTDLKSNISKKYLKIQVLHGKNTLRCVSSYRDQSVNAL
jgi:hypothetical protein